MRKPAVCCFFVCDLFVFLFCCTVPSGGAKIPKDKRSNFKRSNSKRSKFKRSKSKRSKNLLLFGMKRSNCFFSDFFVAFCETLLGEERLACIFEMFRPIHIISHERRQKQTTNCGLSVGRCCGGSYFPVWCWSFVLQRYEVQAGDPVGSHVGYCTAIVGMVRKNC